MGWYKKKVGKKGNSGTVLFSSEPVVSRYYRI